MTNSELKFEPRKLADTQTHAISTAPLGRKDFILGCVVFEIPVVTEVTCVAGN